MPKAKSETKKAPDIFKQIHHVRRDIKASEQLDEKVKILCVSDLDRLKDRLFRWFFPGRADKIEAIENAIADLDAAMELAQDPNVDLGEVNQEMKNAAETLEEEALVK